MRRVMCAAVRHLARKMHSEFNDIDNSWDKKNTEEEKIKNLIKYFESVKEIFKNFNKILDEKSQYFAIFQR